MTAVVEIESVEALSTSDMPNERLAALEEKVNSNIKFFWTVVAFLFLWLAIISGTLFNVNGTVKNVQIAQADAPSRIVAALLAHPTESKTEAAENIGAAASILRTAKVGTVRPNTSVVDTVSKRLVDDQEKYPDLPEVWRATSYFINYKYTALLLPSSIHTATEAAGKPCVKSFQATVTVSNCEASLEDITERLEGNQFNGQDAAFVFLHCVIHYKGGPIKAKHLEFFQCVFQFEVPTAPTSLGLLTMKELTTADPQKSVEIGT